MGHAGMRPRGVFIILHYMKRFWTHESAASLINYAKKEGMVVIFVNYITTSR